MRQEHFDELEADFQQYYNLDIELVPSKKAARLLFQLPRNCRVFTKVQPAVQWGWNEVLLNKMVYLLDTLVWTKSKDAQRKMPQHRPVIFTPEFMPEQTERSEINRDSVAKETEDIRDILALPRV